MAYFLLFNIIIIFYVIKDLIQIFKKNKRPVFWVFVSFSVMVYFSSILIVFDIRTPSFSKYLKELVIMIWNLDRI
ncbi:hypothetical protein L323_08425 [Ruminiclostridium papyrosolvens C7]|uniref:Uncharacterized protein n=1 Tax=Ruminiclostridium papyrosolvens C7 TaxID=1330534 RepID=U4R248_9FIRM|nr:hypothetical protein L323_08425 [Ruminiclostridium papyrosolvens C7]